MPARRERAARRALIPASRARVPGRDRRAGTRRSTPTSSGRSRPRRAPQALWTALAEAGGSRRCPHALDAYPAAELDRPGETRRCSRLRQQYHDRPRGALARGARAAARRGRRAGTRSPTSEFTYHVRGKAITGAQLRRVALAPARSRRSRRRTYQQLGRAAALPDAREPARRVPVHGGRLPVPAHGRRPDAHVRRRRHARADQPPLPLPVARDSRRRGCRRHSTP